jgi:signal transduction histidine kinase
MLLENLQLVDELRRSRARVVSASQEERLRLERNLHDGAQQRLFALLLMIRDARIEAGEGAAGAKLDEIAEEASAALQELRELAHGLYPTVLRDRGLPDALRAVAGRSSLPTEVRDGEVGRLSGAVEEAVYFCALEAIQNAVKHAGQGARVIVSLERHGRDLVFEITDDGVGFELGNHSGGIGLVSMGDRVGAVGGALDLGSAPGRGTTVRGVVPGAFAPG